jgi:hypothetical protein
VERNLLVSQLPVHSSIGVSSALNIGLVTSIKVDLQDTTPINLASGALSGDLGGVYNIFEDGILDSSKRAGTGTQSLGLLATGVRLAKNVALSNNDEMLSRELLFQFTDKTGLNLLERLLKFVRHVDNSGLASRSTINLLGSKDEKIAEGGLELGRRELEVEEFLGNLGLEFIGFLRSSKCDNRQAQRSDDSMGKDHRG